MVDKKGPQLEFISRTLFLIGWYEFPTTSKTLVYPIKEAEFPTVTFCTKNNNPDRWGAVIKILDNLDLICENERYETIGLFCRAIPKKVSPTFETSFWSGLINLSS